MGRHPIMAHVGLVWTHCGVFARHAVPEWSEEARLVVGGGGASIALGDPFPKDFIVCYAGSM